ncbi:hypothetical protein Pmani_022604 [Petrolisthes manimaculis]|uniref:Organic cation transporter protein n=1 Tax=Petrolisthes manimaculis TaxID=1843537 RepID=A0AAE1PCF1_9EUCA|nr:hypothetical protein Pmani_022604 [Petrolisthes manimaculis]
MLLPGQTFVAVYLTPEIPYTCLLPPGAKPIPLSRDNNNNTSSSSTTSTFSNSTVVEKMSQCEYVMVMNDTEEVQQCTEWHFDNTTYGTTLTEEFELVCGKRFLRPVYQSIYFFGAFFGSPASGCLADRFIDESPRWLIVRGHHDRALQVLQKAARWNNTSLPPEHHMRKLMTDITEESTTKPTRGKRGLIVWLQDIFNQLYILIRTRMMRRISLCVFLSMLVSGLAYYGLSIGGEAFHFSPYVYMALSGVMEIPGATVAIPIVNTFGRRRSNIFCYTVAGLVILCLYFIPKSIVWLSVALAMLGKLTISAAYQILYLHSTELFPTEVRIRGSGTASMMAKMGSFIAPFITQSLRDVWSGAPSVVLGSSALLGAVSTFLLPETKGVPLYDTVAKLESEAQNGSERQNKKNKKNSKVRST